MTLDEAWNLSERINEHHERKDGGGRFLAVPFNVGSFALVMLHDRQGGGSPSRSPIVDAARYLDLMERGSTAVESDPDLRDALREWLGLMLARTQNIATAALNSLVPRVVPPA
jgi:hypothetical protein